MKNGPKYVIMSGSCGCMPDNYMYAESIDSAIEQIDSLFDGLPKGAKKELRESRIYYFGDTRDYGAEYVEISDNTETPYDDIEKGF